MVIILELISAKCFHVLLYGLECCQLNKADLQSLDFTSNRLFMKLFRTGSINQVVQECRSCFGTELPSCFIKKRQLLSQYNCVYRNCFVDNVSLKCYIIVIMGDFVNFIYEMYRLQCILQSS